LKKIVNTTVKKTLTAAKRVTVSIMKDMNHCNYFKSFNYHFTPKNSQLILKINGPEGWKNGKKVLKDSPKIYKGLKFIFRKGPSAIFTKAMINSKFATNRQKKTNTYTKFWKNPVGKPKLHSNIYLEHAKANNRKKGGLVVNKKVNIKLNEKKGSNISVVKIKRYIKKNLKHIAGEK